MSITYIIRASCILADGLVLHEPVVRERFPASVALGLGRRVVQASDVDDCTAARPCPDHPTQGFQAHNASIFARHVVEWVKTVMQLKT